MYFTSMFQGFCETPIVMYTVRVLGNFDSLSTIGAFYLFGENPQNERQNTLRHRFFKFSLFHLKMLKCNAINTNY